MLQQSNYHRPVSIPIGHVSKYFSEWCGHGLPIENLDANRWIEWYKVVQSSNISVSYKKKGLCSSRPSSRGLLREN